MELNFKINPHENIFSHPSTELDLPEPKTAETEQKSVPLVKDKPENNNTSKSDVSRLNDFDNKIMENYAFKDIDNEVLKLELNINHLEKRLVKINNEIKTIEGLGSDIQLNDLKFRRDLLETELEKLTKEYEKQSLSAGLSLRISNSIKKIGNANILFNIISGIYNFVMTKCSKKYRYSVMVKESLASLNTINSKVDELINMHSPYGETENRYMKLTAFINRANYLHSKIISSNK